MGAAAARGFSQFKPLYTILQVARGAPQAQASRSSLPWRGLIVDLRGNHVGPCSHSPPPSYPLTALPKDTPLQLSLSKPHRKGYSAAWTVEAPPVATPVWSISSPGTTVRNGCIDLPAQGFLVLTSSCRNLSLQNVTIRGMVQLLTSSRFIP
jgi:hypothetical protein